MQQLKHAWLKLSQTQPLLETQCYRLLSAGDIQADIYGSVLWVYWYREAAPSATEQKEVFDFAESVQKTACIRHMLNRGTGVGGKETEGLFCSPTAPKEWTALENKIKYLLKQNSGFSPGLFLDQAENRDWVLKNSPVKRVLNLFSYTSGFSVAAALGKASEVTTVDVSASFLEWSKKNFELNLLQPRDYEFFCQDVMLFMTGAAKRKRKWDLIICDPPSFGRAKDSIWKIEKDLPELSEKMAECLSPQGQILFTCNYEKWTPQDVLKNLTMKFKPAKAQPIPMGYLLSSK